MSLLGQVQDKPGRGSHCGQVPQVVWGGRGDDDDDDAPRQHPSQVTDPLARLYS